jgi:hypothetical protein
MRWIFVTLSVLAAACGGQERNSPTSPTSVTAAEGLNLDTPVGVSQTQSRGGTHLPFRGSFTTTTDTPPPLAHATVDAGTATQLGRFTGTLTAVVNPATDTSTGTFEFTAADGDQLSGTFIGVEGVFIPPNTARITEVATITGGTGRFAGAGGSFTMVRVDTIDVATGAASGTGSLDGHLNLNR